MPVLIEGSYIGENRKFAIIASRFNSTVSKRLVEGSLDALKRHKTDDKNITVIWVPGAFEIPSIAKKLIKKDFSAVICLGAVIRGETPHFDYISSEVTKGIAQIALEANIPIVFGIITADTQEQALDRAGIKMGNKGFQAAMTAMEMVSLYNLMDE